jgi:DHA3 family macrolide efflux protein-like MFS transporter
MDWAIVSGMSTGRGVWNRNFFILWQGQLVSALGDVVYTMALGFWVLEATGSTAIMGSLMAAATLPRVLVSPFAGVVVDRTNRKRLLVLMDVLRGVAVLLVALAAFRGGLQVWMAFGAAVAIGIGGAFFSPGVNTVLPSIVPRERLIQANSAYNMLYTGSGMLGNSVGGFLLQFLGAPFLFLFNGLSYLVSSLTLLAVRIPPTPPPRRVQRFLADLRDGLNLVWRMKGLRTIFLTAAALNFFGVMGITLILPLFQKSPALGAARYGLVMACITGGMFAGFTAASAVKLPPAARFRVFMTCGVVSVGCWIGFALLRWFPAMLGLGLLSGFLIAILNSILPALVQTVVPSDMIGKVSALLMTLAGGLMPLAMAAAGGLAEAFPIRTLMAGSFIVELLCLLPLYAAPSFKRFITFDPLKDTPESLMT